MTRVSVIIPCYNAEPWISEALLSVDSQQCADLETFVVDDGSTDGSAEVVRKEFPSVRLIRTPNQGASRARNTGTRLATGQFIQYLDADDLLAPGKIAAQMQKLEETDADVAYGDWQRLVRDGENEFRHGEVVARRISSAPELDLFRNFWCPPATYLFRRRIVDKVGQWNEGLPVIQDARFALDCALHGATFVYCSGVMAYYRQHGNGSLSRRDPKAFVRDVYRNTREIEQWWQCHGGLTDARIAALLECYAQVARASYEDDREGFENAYADLNRLSPGYIPSGPRRLSWAARAIGYKRAESAALIYRIAKRTLLPRRA